MSYSSSISYTSSYFKYHVKFDDKTIETIVTNGCDVIDAWVKEILVAHADNPNVVVGFHVKCCDWFPKTKCILLCTETKCIILQVSSKKDITQSFKNFLMNSNITFVGAHEDFTLLDCEYGLDCAKSEDIRTAVIRKWPRRFQRHDFEYLAKELGGLDLNKKRDDFKTGWGDRVLDDTLVEYACVIAYAAYKIGNVLLLKQESTEPQVIKKEN